MSAITEWPNVGALIEAKLTMPVLDKRAARYTPERLREMVDRYASDPEITELLNILASHPALNKKLNRNPASVRNANIALHYLIACKLEPKKLAARQRVADVWLIAPATVKDIAIEHGPTALTWLVNLIEHIDVRSEFATRDEILRALDADMIARAPVLGAKGGKYLPPR
jgi:hypothetical protein